MRFSLLYSNNESIFPTIDFQRGFNVIFAQVREPFLKERDSHNLGKTFLIRVLDFGLLGSVKKNHPFKEHKEIFGDFIFFLEIETVAGEFVTVRRAVEGRNAINVYVSSEPKSDLRTLPLASWTYPNLSLKKARTTLDKVLNLSAIKPYSFRKGLGYFLRKQSDYDAVFRISKFQYGAHKEWKPFVSLLLGFDDNLIDRKYESDTEVERLQQTVDLLEEEAGSRSSEYDEVRGLLEIRSAALKKMREELESFSFHDIEATISETTVNEIETEIAYINVHRPTSHLVLAKFR